MTRLMKEIQKQSIPQLNLGLAIMYKRFNEKDSIGGAKSPGIKRSDAIKADLWIGLGVRFQKSMVSATAMAKTPAILIVGSSGTRGEDRCDISGS